MLGHDRIGVALSLAMVATTILTSHIAGGILTGYVPPINVTIVGLYPVTGSLASPGQDIASAAKLAVSHVNAEPLLLPNTRIILEAVDTQASAAQTTLSLLATLRNVQRIVAISGAAVSSVSRSVQNIVSVFNIPMISPASTAAVLSNKALYPTFMRVVPPDTLHGSATASTIKSIGWRRIATIFHDDDYGISSSQSLVTKAVELGIEVSAQISFPFGTTDFVTVVDAIEKLSDTHVLFIACYTFEAVELFRELIKRDLTTGRFVFFGSDWLVDEFFESDLDQDKLHGLLVLQYLLDSSPLMDAFTDEWETLNSTEYLGAGDRTYSQFAPLSYDTVMTTAYALQAAIDDGVDVFDGQVLLPYMAQTTFIGLTGNISFDVNYDRISPLAIRNYKGGAALQTVGQWDTASNSLVFTDSIIYPGNMTRPPHLPIVASPESDKLFIVFVTVGVAIIVMAAIMLTVSIVIIRRRRAQVASLEEQNKQLNLEARALNSRLDVLSEQTAMASGRQSGPVIDMPVNQVLGLLWRLQGSVRNPIDVRDINSAIEAIQSNVLFTPETRDDASVSSNRDNLTRDWIRKTLIGGTGPAAAGTHGSASYTRRGSHVRSGSRILLPISPSPPSPLDLGVSRETAFKPAPHLAPLLENLASLEFDIFALAIRDTCTLRSVFLAICTEKQLFTQLGLDSSALARYMMVLDKACEGMSNPYHNVLHAADMVQFVHFLLSTSGLYAVLSPLESFAALFAAAIKDVGHPGVDSSYLIKTKSVLAIRYSNRSVLEQHALAMAFQLALADKFDVFAPLSAKSFAAFHELVVELVIGTDMHKHVEVMSRFKIAFGLGREGGSEALPQHGQAPLQGSQLLEGIQSNAKLRTIVLQLIVKMADVSYPSRPWAKANSWAHRYSREAFQQGKQERAHGLAVSPFMDGMASSVAKAHVSMIRIVALPMFQAWCELFPIDECLGHMRHCLRHWSSASTDEMEHAHETALAAMDAFDRTFFASDGGSPVVTNGGMQKSTLAPNQPNYIESVISGLLDVLDDDELCEEDEDNEATPVASGADADIAVALDAHGGEE
ncbi:cAMP-specific phosphodiesterase-4 B isoform [Thecamonas trahens ATCC 50062]|uniref:cAMP-specific phosphodiesterase-4 B isoform n=1 Tax=Thecamonas trahens ATCC 50062 TaxID=461836 RepID=A0A0L0DIT0_THETB|nr:cAMP-specific phosphodiesterase-4 B isoform [Thecamonas trahens ATCC 50062]KNC52294.1 cAMP-specific phosphodiesterase-4 B isoform [Thecamonas trahens ATCC 50062]|eukprot:XP_013762293.1 cAMP-specific phosphodiesterase-4 B isoform [Thecamonas trahens ATCC 50062]